MEQAVFGVESLGLGGLRFYLSAGEGLQVLAALWD